jgi:hypothetical protein
VIEAALRGTARFEPAGLSATIFLATIIATAIFVASRFIAAGFAALRGSVFRWRKIASAYCRSLRASAAMAPTTTAVAATSTAVTASISSTPVTGTAEILAAAIAAAV